jgi:hypothetical protein
MKRIKKAISKVKEEVKERMIKMKKTMILELVSRTKDIGISKMQKNGTKLSS